MSLRKNPVNIRNEQRVSSAKKLHIGSAKKLNLTTLSNPSTSSRNSNPNLTSVVLTPKEDLDFLFDVAFNDYLQECAKKEIILKTIQQQQSVCNNQLEKQSEVLTSLEEQTLELEIEIETQTIQQELNNSSKELLDLLDKSCSILNMDKEKCIQELIIVLERFSSRLYLNSFEVLQTQEEFDKFQEVLQKCVNVLKYFNSCSGDMNAINILTSCLQKNIQLQQELLKKNVIVADLHKEVAKLTLEKASDLLDM